MAQVTIVGVEGSGKTVLMTAMGRYMNAPMQRAIFYLRKILRHSILLKCK